MKYFLQKLLVYTLMFACFAVLVCIVTSLLAHPYMEKKGRGSVIDKNQRLASLSSPKIVLVGGSNVCYGINSQLLQDSLNMPVVDMAINADVGMLFYFNQVKPYIHKGDIVIGIPEYGADKRFWGDESMYELAIAEGKNLQTITFMQWLRLPMYLGTIIKDNYNIIFSDKNAIVNNGRKLYDSLGDYEGHHGSTLNLATLKENREIGKTGESIDPAYVSIVKDFDRYCRARSAMYLESFPVYAKAQYNKSYTEALIKELEGIHFIGSPQKYLYDYNQLYDSPNHLIFSMRNERTMKLIEDVKKEMQ